MTRLTDFLGARAGKALAGLILVVLIAGLCVAGVAKGFGAFSTSTTIRAVVPTAGPALSKGAEVQYRGVLVGTLASIDREPARTVLTLHLHPSQVDQIPAGATVRLVPRSVFGDLYVDLVAPPHPSGHVQSGQVLRADRTTATTQLNAALNAGYDLLTAVRPSKIDETLTALATALHGRGAELGRLIDEAHQYLRRTAPSTGQFVHDVSAIANVGRELARDAPDLLRTLDDTIAISHAIVAAQPNLRALLHIGPPVSDQTNALLANNRHRLALLVRLLRPVIGALNNHRPDLVRAVRELQHFLPRAAGALDQGPFLNVLLSTDLNPNDAKPYTATDCPRYPGMAGPNCPGSKASAR